MAKFLITIVMLIFNLGIALGSESDSLQLINQLNNFKLETGKDLKNYQDFFIDNKSKLSLSLTQKKLFFKKGYSAAIHQEIDSMTILFSMKLGRLYETTAKNKLELDSSIFYYQTILDIGKKRGDFAIVGKAYNQIGGSLFGKGELENAIEHFYQSIDAYKKSDTPEESTYALSNLSKIYYNSEDVHTAIQYSKEGLEMCQLLSDEDKYYNIVYKCSNLIYYFEEINEPDSAFYYLKKGEAAIEKLISFPNENRIEGVLFNYYNSCISYYLSRKDITNVKRFFNKISKNKLNNTPYGYILQLKYNLAIDNISRATDLFNNAPELLKDTSSFYNLYFLEQRVNYYEKIGEYQKAFADLKMLNELEDKEQEKGKLQNRKLLKYQLDLREQENKIELLKKDNDFKSLLIKLVGIGIIGILLASLFFFRQSKITQKKNAQLKAQSDIIDQQSKKIKAEVDSKEMLFTNISHELRTPLTIISGAIHQLKNSIFNDESNLNAVELISNGSNQLTELTDQILDIVKHKYTSTKPQLFSLQLEELIKHLDHQFSSKAKQQNISLIFKNQNNASNSPISLITDVEKLLSIFKNLIVNALKYSKNEGEILINLSVENSLLKFSVQDNGLGIAKNDIPFIFDRFYQSPKRKSSQGGVGIGLAICKEYIQVLNGEIKVESEEDLGSTFFVEIPVELSSTDTNIKPYIFQEIFSPPSPSLPKIKEGDQDDYLLIVEDNEDLCQYLWSTLKKDYNISFASDGKEAISQIELNRPTVIVTDWMMNGMDGKELVHYLKGDENYASIPVLMMTARNSLEDKMSILRIGVDGYITKPFAPDSLIHHINHLFNLVENRRNEITELDDNSSLILKKHEIQFLKKLEETISDNLSNFDFTLENVSKEMTISLRQLNRKVKQLTGLTPKQYINEIRFQEAKRMLESKEYDSVKAVTYSVGFKSEQYFSRNFKHRFGKYPKDILYG